MHMEFQDFNEYIKVVYTLLIMAATTQGQMRREQQSEASTASLGRRVSYSAILPGNAIQIATEVPPALFCMTLHPQWPPL